MFIKETQRPTKKGKEWAIPTLFPRARRPCQNDMSCLKSLCHSRTFALSNEVMKNNGQEAYLRAARVVTGMLSTTRRERSYYSNPTEYVIYPKLMATISCFSFSPFLNDNLDEFIPSFLLHCRWRW